MLKKSILIAAVIMLVFSSGLIVSAQEKPAEMKGDHTLMKNDDMKKCMDKIASDEHMRGTMMQKMMDQTKEDSSSMMQMCKKMMNNPKMHKMMMKMMGGESGVMDGKMMNHEIKMDSTKTISKPEHETHHKK